MSNEINKTPAGAPAPSIGDLLEMLRRRKSWGILAALVVVLGLSLYLTFAKDRYHARVLMAVEPGTETSTSYDPTVRMQEQVRGVREVLFSDAVFKPVVEEFGLVKGSPLPPQRAVEEVQSRVKLELDGESGFYVGFEGQDRGQVASVANRLSELLSSKSKEKRAERSEKETSVVDADVQRLKSELNGLDDRIEQYKERAVREMPERIDDNLKRLETIQTQLRDIVTTVASDEARRSGVLIEMGDLEKQGLIADPGPAPLPKSANAEKLAAAKLDLERLEARYSKDHPALIAGKNDVRNLQALVDAEPPQVATRAVSPAQLRYTQLRAEAETIDKRLISLRQQRLTLAAQLADYERRVDSSPRHEVVLNQLAREKDIAKTQYEKQLTKQAEARSDSQIKNVTHSLGFRIVEPAKIPLDPFAPNRLRLLLLGLGAALAVGLGTIFLVEQVDSTFKDTEELQRYTGLNVLSLVPRVKAALSKPQDAIVTLVDPKSVPAEQYQILATRLRHQGRSDTGRVLTVTSAAGGEGKTFTSINLAVALTSSGARVLLIDADLRRPRVHQYLKLRSSNELGLAAFMANPDRPISTFAVNVSGLTVLPGLITSQNPLKLLSSPKLPPLIARLRAEFDFIVFDAPPILPIADGIVLGSLSDQVVLVVRARRTTRAVLRRAMESIDGSNVAGVILNDVDMSSSKYAYVYRYYENTYLRGA